MTSAMFPASVYYGPNRRSTARLAKSCPPNSFVIALRVDRSRAIAPHDIVGACSKSSIVIELPVVVTCKLMAGPSVHDLILESPSGTEAPPSGP